AFQQIFLSYSTIVGNWPSVKEVLHYVNLPIPHEALVAEDESLPFFDEIAFEQVGFKYSSDGDLVLESFSARIPKGSKIGIVGKTGSGKSTLIDLLMGLLSPTMGTIRVDQTVLDDSNIRRWQKNIAHVPQFIFLMDATVLENVAFGIPIDKIDIDQVR